MMSLSTFTFFHRKKPGECPRPPRGHGPAARRAAGRRQSSRHRGLAEGLRGRASQQRALDAEPLMFGRRFNGTKKGGSLTIGSFGVIKIWFQNFLGEYLCRKLELLGCAG